MTFDPDKYVEITPESATLAPPWTYTPYFHDERPYSDHPWSQDGFPPKLAKEIANRILELADEAEKPKPENWPPQKNDVWAVRFSPSEIFVCTDGSSLTAIGELQSLSWKFSEIEKLAGFVDRVKLIWRPVD